MTAPRQYRLVVDLTRYHPAFEVGVIGVFSGHSRRSDRFFYLRLPDKSRLEVLWESVEPVEPEEP